MSDSQIWIGLADVVPTEGSDYLEGAAGAYVNVVGKASSKSAFEERVNAEISKYGLLILSLENVVLLSSWLQKHQIDDEIRGIVNSVKLEGGVRFGTLHCYPHEETPA